ncbi:hypothetical protein Dimus_003397, partial [Dionaea muscipula]
MSEALLRTMANFVVGFEGVSALIRCPAMVSSLCSSLLADENGGSTKHGVPVDGNLMEHPLLSSVGGVALVEEKNFTVVGDGAGGTAASRGEVGGAASRLMAASPFYGVKDWDRPAKVGLQRPPLSAVDVNS